MEEHAPGFDVWTVNPLFDLWTLMEDPNGPLFAKSVVIPGQRSVIQRQQAN
jgi:hypothetical protein